MPFSSGTFSLNSTYNPVVTGTTISIAWANNTLTDIATGLTTCVLKDGSQTITANIPMNSFKFTGLAAGSANGDSLRYQQLFTTSAVTLLGAMDWVKGADIASAATVNLTTATGNAVHITGTTTITAVTLGSGMLRIVIFDGALTLTHHATNNNLPGGANITTAANDRALYWADGTTVYCVAYQTAASSPVGTVQTLTHKGLVDISAAAAGQIKFPASQNASADVNTLDDYEEGSWTPAVGGTATYASQIGRYVKVGKQVTITCELSITSIGSGSTSTISGVPFAAADISLSQGAALSFWSGLGANYVYIAATVLTNTATVVFNTATAATATIGATTAILGDNTVVRFTITYIAAA